MPAHWLLAQHAATQSWNPCDGLLDHEELVKDPPCRSCPTILMLVEMLCGAGHGPGGRPVAGRSREGRSRSGAEHAIVPE